MGTVPGDKAWGHVGAGMGVGAEADGQRGEPIWGGIPQPPAATQRCARPLAAHPGSDRSECPGRHVLFVDLAPTGSHLLPTRMGTAHTE